MSGRGGHDEAVDCFLEVGGEGVEGGETGHGSCLILHNGVAVVVGGGGVQ